MKCASVDNLVTKPPHKVLLEPLIQTKIHLGPLYFYNCVQSEITEDVQPYVFFSTESGFWLCMSAVLGPCLWVGESGAAGGKSRKASAQSLHMTVYWGTSRKLN